MGYLGTERVLALVRDRFYWPYMRKDIEHFVTNVCSCLKRRRPNLPTRDPLHPITTTSPTAANINKQRGKKHYDSKVRSSVLEPGDRVLVRNLSPRGGPEKLRSFWEEEVYLVVSRKGPDSPVYEVRPESKTSKSRTLHRNMLLPCDHLSPEPAKPKPRERKKQNPPVRNHPIDDTCSSSDDDEFLPVLHPLPTNVEVGERHEDGQADEEEATITEPGEANYQSNDPVADMNETNHAETDGEADYQSNDLVADMNETNHAEINGEDYQRNDPEAAASEAIVDNFANRPHRNRQAPQRFTYYAPGHAACSRCYTTDPATLSVPAISTTDPATQSVPAISITDPATLSVQHLTPRPIQHPWYSNDSTFMNEW